MLAFFAGFGVMILMAHYYDNQRQIRFDERQRLRRVAIDSILSEQKRIKLL